MEPKEGQKYKDQYGQIWEVKINNRNQPQLWREESGWGLWDSGKGLELIDKALEK